MCKSIFAKFATIGAALAALLTAVAYGETLKGEIAPEIAAEIDADYPWLEQLYRDFHQNPELSFMEVETAARMAEEFRHLGFTVTEKVGKTGVVGVMKNGPGPTLMLRADMDALPVVEQTGLAFASTKIGRNQFGEEQPIMHACGHDIHMTVLIGTLRRLVEHKDKWSGTLVVIAQPAEEIGLGAAAMLEDGLFTRFPRPDYNLALHDSAGFPAGMVAYTPGWALANVDSVDVIVKGVGGHGAYPHTTKDPIVIASQIVMVLQTLVSREINPLDSAVVTVGAFNAGHKHNIISSEAHLQITVRSYSDDVRETLLSGIQRIAKAQAMSAGLPEELYPVVTWEEDYTPATYNDPEFTRRIAGAFTKIFGGARVIEVDPVMGGEDFAHYGRTDPKIPSLLFWIGGVNKDDYREAQEKGESLPSLHSPFWAPDAEPTIKTGIAAMSAASFDILGKE
jgi:amidohydrolase